LKLFFIPNKQMFENQELNQKNKIIFLIGFMGAGKTTLGKNLADILNYEFIDSDLWIENQQSMTIASIFDKKGESFFRTLEFDFLNNLILKKSTIIATGGGLPCHNDNLGKMQNMGTIIYLKVSPSQIMKRIRLNETRPLFKNLQNENDKELFIETKLKERCVFYEQANFIIDAEQPIDKQINDIKCRIF